MSYGKLNMGTGVKEPGSLVPASRFPLVTLKQFLLSGALQRLMRPSGWDVVSSSSLHKSFPCHDHLFLSLPQGTSLSMLTSKL